MSGDCELRAVGCFDLKEKNLSISLGAFDERMTLSDLVLDV